MIDIKPVTRIETLLKEIKDALSGNESPSGFTPASREELFLSAIAKKIKGQDSYVPTPSTRKEMYLNAILAATSAKVCSVPTPITREEMFLSAIAARMTGQAASVPTPAARKETFLADIASESYMDISSTIVPVQTGTGEPYPAGGGVNKFDEVLESGGISSATGQNTPQGGTLRSTNYCAIPVGEQIYLGNYKAGGLVYLFYYDSDKTYLGSSGGWQTSGVKTPPSGAYYFRLQLNADYGTTYTNDISVNYPSTDHDYHPYSNIRPISGWTGANIYVRGKNLCNLQYFLGNVSTHTLDFYGGHAATGAFKANGTYLKANTTYTITIDLGVAPDAKWRVYGAYTESTSITLLMGERLGRTNSFSVTPIADTKIVFWAYIGDTWAQHGVTSIDGVTVQVELGSTATAYEAYHGNTYTISWQSEAGTVYGGTLDATLGKLIVTDANIASYNGEELPGEWICDRAVYAPDTTPPTGSQVVYKLATPLEYALSATEIQLLMGENNIYADCGDITVTWTTEAEEGEE